MRFGLVPFLNLGRLPQLSLRSTSGHAEVLFDLIDILVLYQMVRNQKFGSKDIRLTFGINVRRKPATRLDIGECGVLGIMEEEVP
jgi:hypothetical protein